jgi:hypothetical protein
MDIKWASVALIVLLSVKTTSSNANELYVTQSGNNFKLTVTQDGENNIAGFSGSGNNNTITETQIGNNNDLGSIGPNDTSDGNNNTMTFVQIGDYHQFQGDLDGDGNTLDVYQGGSGESNFIRSDVDGDNNDVKIWQGKKVDGTTDTTEGGDHEAYVTITGNNNVYHSAQTDQASNCCASAHHLADIITGDYNDVEHKQRGNGAHEGFVEVTGDYNDVDLLQRGNQGSNWANIEITGDSNLVAVDQLGNGAHTADINLSSINGPAYNFSLTQDSANNQSYSMTSVCTNPSGCSVSVIQN